MATTSVKLARLTTLALFSPTPTPSCPKSTKHRAKAPPPISISMDPALVDPAHLQALMLACAHSCALRLSPALSVSAIEPVNLSKLQTALAHSFIVVSVFCGARFLTGDGEGEGEGQIFLGLERQGERQLVGFGRAVSDLGLTASVHDIVVHPSLQRRGIGRKIVNKITRVLHSRGIYDISALCTEKERRREHAATTVYVVHPTQFRTVVQQLTGPTSPPPPLSTHQHVGGGGGNGAAASTRTNAQAQNGGAEQSGDSGRGRTLGQMHQDCLAWANADDSDS